jgi:hypothetical protein
VVVLPTLAYDRIDTALIVVHAAKPPSDSDWNRLMREPLVATKGCIVVAGATKLDAKKRRLLAENVKNLDIKVAVLVSSSVARGIVTALGWLVGGYRAFEMSELEQAAAYVGLPTARAADVQRVVRELQLELQNEGTKPEASGP